MFFVIIETAMRKNERTPAIRKLTNLAPCSLSQIFLKFANENEKLVEELGRLEPGCKQSTLKAAELICNFLQGKTEQLNSYNGPCLGCKIHIALNLNSLRIIHSSPPM